MQEEAGTIKPDEPNTSKPTSEKINRAVSIGCGIIYLGGIFWSLLADDAVRANIWWHLSRILQIIAGGLGFLGIKSEKAYYHTVELMHS